MGNVGACDPADTSSHAAHDCDGQISPTVQACARRRERERGRERERDRAQCSRHLLLQTLRRRLPAGAGASRLLAVLPRVVSSPTCSQVMGESGEFNVRLGNGYIDQNHVLCECKAFGPDGHCVIAPSNDGADSLSPHRITTLVCCGGRGSRAVRLSRRRVQPVHVLGRLPVPAVRGTLSSALPSLRWWRRSACSGHIGHWRVRRHSAALQTAALARVFQPRVTCHRIRFLLV
jgi:hypothetical protein